MLIFPVQRLILLRGVETPDKGQLARALAAALPAPSIQLRFADLAEHWIVRPSRDRTAELSIAYRLLKLITVTYLKEGYSVVVDAPFVDAGTQVVLRYDEKDDLLRLARTFRRVQPSLVTLLDEGGSDEGRAATAALRADHSDADIQVEGQGGNIDGFAQQLMARIANQ